jgi:hypothetical protein
MGGRQEYILEVSIDVLMYVLYSQCHMNQIASFLCWKNPFSLSKPSQSSKWRKLMLNSTHLLFSLVISFQLSPSIALIIHGLIPCPVVGTDMSGIKSHPLKTQYSAVY